MTKKLISRLKKGRKLLKDSGGIMKGLDDLDTSKIPGYGIISNSIQSYRLPSLLKEVQEKIGAGTAAMTKYDMFNHEDENAINRKQTAETNSEEIKKLLSRNIGKYGLLSKRRALLNNQSEIQPITSGEWLFKDITQYGNTTTKLKKGGILKGQDDTKVIDTRENEVNDKHYSTNIREGETLSDVARIYGTSVNELMKLNPKIKDKNKIKAGEEILVPFKYSQIPQRTYKTFRYEDIPRDYWNKPHAYAWDDINAADINLPYPYGNIFLNEGEYEVDSEGNIKTYPMIVPKYYFNEDAARNARDRYEAWKYGKEEQEFLRNNQLYMSGRPVGLPIKYLYTYHNIPNTDAGHYIVEQINGIDKSKLKPGYTINSYMYDNGLNSPVSVIRDEKGRRVFVVGHEDRLIGSGHTPTYLLTIGDDFFYPDYLLQYK